MPPPQLDGLIEGVAGANPCAAACHGTSSSGVGSGDDWLSPSHPDFSLFAVICVLLICFGGVMSGLQQAIMHVSTAELQSWRNEGSESEKKVACSHPSSTVAT